MRVHFFLLRFLSLRSTTLFVPLFDSLFVFFINLIKDKTQTRKIYGAAACLLCQIIPSLSQRTLFVSFPHEQYLRTSIQLLQLTVIFIILYKCERINFCHFFFSFACTNNKHCWTQLSGLERLSYAIRRKLKAKNDTAKCNETFLAIFVHFKWRNKWNA